MKKLLLTLSVLTAPVFAQNRAACNFTDSEGDECCGHSVPAGAAQHELYLEAVRVAQTNPELAGTTVGVRVGTEWSVVDRTAEKKNPGPVSPTTLEVLNRLAGRNVSGSVTITYVRVTGYTDKGQPLYETITFNAGGGTTSGDAEAQEAMDKAIGKSHK